MTHRQGSGILVPPALRPIRTLCVFRHVTDIVDASPCQGVVASTGGLRLFALDLVTAPTYQYPTTPMWEQPMGDLRTYDENLVKPLVLFADRITLRSERIDMLSLIQSVAFRTSRMPMRRIWQYMAASSARDERLLAQLGLPSSNLAQPEDVNALMALEASNEGDHTARMEALHRFERKYSPQIEEFSQATLDLLEKRRDQLTSPGLETLVELGILDVTGWSAGQNDAWSLAWQPELDFLLDNIDDVENYLRGSEGAVMLEPGSSFFLGVGPVNTTAPRTMDLPAHLAASFISRLPGLKSADLGELIEVRDDLKDYLTPFRASMATMAKDVADAVGERPEALISEIEVRWARDVAPVLQELAVKAKRGSYPRELLNVVTEDKGALASTAASIVLAAGSAAAGLATLIPAAAAASYPFAKALKEMVEEREMREDNQLFFLYSAQQRLPTRP